MRSDYWDRPAFETVRPRRLTAPVVFNSAHSGRDYPDRFGQFVDSDGRPPRHTFFYPIDQYDSTHVDALAGLCRGGFGEIEVHEVTP